MPGKPKTNEKSPPKVTAREAVEVVLLDAGRPMHYREIARVALERGIVKVRGGKKPDEQATIRTVRSYLAGSAAAGDKFVRIDPGVFDLKERPAPTAEKTS
jgi:hypothetical protein